MIGLLVALAGLNGMAMVALAAYGAHGMDGIDITYRAMFETGWRIHSIHSAVLLAIGMSSRPNRWLHGAFWLIVAGMVCFCGPLYGPGLEIGVPGGFLTPVGGFLLIAGWFCLVLAGIHRMVTRSRGDGERAQYRPYHWPDNHRPDNHLPDNGQSRDAGSRSQA